MNIRERYIYFLKRIEEGYYTIIDGRIFNKNGKEMKNKETYGYRILDTRQNGRSYTVKQHRLLYAYYNGLDSLIDGLTINHINGNKEDNRKENLEQITFSANAKHAREIGLQPRIKRKISFEQAEEIRKLNKEGKSQRFLAKQYGVEKNTISNILHYKTHKY